MRYQGNPPVLDPHQGGPRFAPQFLTCIVHIFFTKGKQFAYLRYAQTQLRIAIDSADFKLRNVLFH